ncbi:MAG: twin-arginine translocase TatA/TatE family subunit [Acidimicrobiales bacterium]
MLTAEILGPDLIIVIVVAVIVLLFGGSKLPKLARGLGSASHEFKKGLEEGHEESQASAVPPSPAAPAVPPAVVQAPPVVAPVPEAQQVPKDASSS